MLKMGIVSKIRGSQVRVIMRDVYTTYFISIATDAALIWVKKYMFI
jgi:hypothetical protein